jgi:uncharacterized protein YbjT (DUF2867 family)
MKTKGKSAIILGATGLTGNILLKLLLQDERYGQIKTFARSPLGLKHPKLVEKQCDLLELNKQAHDFYADDIFCCIGTTKAKTPDKEKYRAIDYGIPKMAAALAKKNKADCFIVISALGANANSSLFYPKIKGEMEQAVLAEKINRTFLLQPGLIGGHRQEHRTGEYLFKQLMGAIDFLLVGPLKKYRLIAPEHIAQVMIWLGNHAYDGVRIPSNKIRDLANTYGKIRS